MYQEQKLIIIKKKQNNKCERKTVKIFNNKKVIFQEFLRNINNKKRPYYTFFV